MSKEKAIIHIQNIMTMLNGKDSRIFSKGEYLRLSDDLFQALKELED